MSSVVAQTYLTPEEYLAFERKLLPSIDCELRLQDVYRRVEVASG